MTSNAFAVSSSSKPFKAGEVGAGGVIVPCWCRVVPQHWRRRRRKRRRTRMERKEIPPKEKGFDLMSVFSSLFSKSFVF